MRASRKPYTASRRSVPIAPRRPERPEGRRARRTIDQEVRPMRKVILCIAMLALLVVPLTAEAHGRFVVQGPFFWHPFFFPGPFVYGYPGGFAYGYPGPYDYGTLTYSHPRCHAKPDGYWICS